MNNFLKMEFTWETSGVDVAMIIAIFAVLIVFVVAKSFYNKSRSSGVDKKFIAERWKQIDDLVQHGKQMNYKLAVIEADKLLDHVLQELNFPGTKMSDRLKMASYKFPALKQVWWAHKVRNKVVHEVRYSLSAGETRKVISLFKKALKILRVL